uniref:Uncharacterized protein n=1 Tax=Ananas comosus var. bracteatus TaxID=296719 RepID=A0A6V7Q2M0_ANACO|nr:unnamed protein product [Ananas comosus var. bracteatus]
MYIVTQVFQLNVLESRDHGKLGKYALGEQVVHRLVKNPTQHKSRAFRPSFLTEIFWRVIESVPTYGSYSENCSILSSAKVTKMMELGCSRVAVCRAVYQYNIDVVPEQMVYRYNIGSVPVHMRIFCEPDARGTRGVVDTFVGANEGHEDLVLETDFYACLPLCSFAHACKGRSLQAGTPKIAIATYTRPCGIGCRSGLPWVRLIPRVGMLTTTGPLGTAQTRQPTGGSSGYTAYGRVLQDWNFK